MSLDVSSPEHDTGALVRDAVWDNFGERLLTGGDDGRVCVCEKGHTTTLKVHRAPVLRVMWAHAEFGPIFASVGADRQWKVFRGQMTQQGAQWKEAFSHTSTEALVDAGFAPRTAGFWLAVQSRSGRVLVYAADADADASQCSPPLETLALPELQRLRRENSRLRKDVADLRQQTLKGATPQAVDLAEQLHDTKQQLAVTESELERSAAENDELVRRLSAVELQLKDVKVDARNARRSSLQAQEEASAYLKRTQRLQEALDSQRRRSTQMLESAPPGSLAEHMKEKEDMSRQINSLRREKDEAVRKSRASVIAAKALEDTTRQLDAQLKAKDAELSLAKASFQSALRQERRSSAALLRETGLLCMHIDTVA
ncbi:MAG: hypothetical protein MHM6MM_000446 [Cercozoa sp. M6MM]